MEAEDTKPCPFCAETIKAAAIVCRFCGRDQPATNPSASESVASPLPDPRATSRTVVPEVPFDVTVETRRGLVIPSVVAEALRSSGHAQAARDYTTAVAALTTDAYQLRAETERWVRVTDAPGVTRPQAAPPRPGWPTERETAAPLAGTPTSRAGRNSRRLVAIGTAAVVVAATAAGIAIVVARGSSAPEPETVYCPAQADFEALGGIGEFNPDRPSHRGIMGIPENAIVVGCDADTRAYDEATARVRAGWDTMTEDRRTAQCATYLTLGETAFLAQAMREGTPRMHAAASVDFLETVCR